MPPIPISTKAIFLIKWDATPVRWWTLDEPDMLTIASLAQAVVLAVTIWILILQFRNQERATKETAYQKVLDDYNDTVRTLVGHPELGVLIDDLVRTGPVATQ